MDSNKDIIMHEVLQSETSQLEEPQFYRKLHNMILNGDYFCHKDSIRFSYTFNDYIFNMKNKIINYTWCDEIPQKNIFDYNSKYNYMTLEQAKQYNCDINIFNKIIYQLQDNITVKFISAEPTRKCPEKDYPFSNIICDVEYVVVSSQNIKSHNNHYVKEPHRKYSIGEPYKKYSIEKLQKIIKKNTKQVKYNCIGIAYFKVIDDIKIYDDFAFIVSNKLEYPIFGRYFDDQHNKITSINKLENEDYTYIDIITGKIHIACENNKYINSLSGNFKLAYEHFNKS